MRIRTTTRQRFITLAAAIGLVCTGGVMLTARRAPGGEIEHYVGRREAQQTKTSSGWSNVSGASISMKK